ncbi:hypothetical protein ERX46_08830 [Brumimicrobium glaciale]|uniref:SbsA Ig-like domain-containing protein n=1 Tax=Brumimicrobium glaciale TaxID=200475 RepID=A0A4Q4KLA2_9FLAO|nr:Ig-like domain-containing protein [Brumimicrobium glaciale]RYM34055.1 hypothetical protein ERX46_08830 [Brumimicrobium glaciale]
MARFNYIIWGILSLLLVACGQVGSITGGEKDITAPGIIQERVNPPMGSINTSPQEITIPFDEFIEFNKPAENIRVTPADVKLDYTINKKSVVLAVKTGEWKPNTTYTVYLNRAVKDITEANDSIIAYVFSTGNFLDSLKTAVQVQDAYSGKPVSGVTVGLFTQKLINDTSKVEPRYYASTNEEGIAFFQYIKDTTFFIYAFEDDNLNNRLDATEKRAILNRLVELDTVFETVPTIRLMAPEANELNIISNEVIPTSTWCLSFNRPLSEEENFSFIAPQPAHVIWNKTKDSLSAFYESSSNSGSFSGVLQSSEKSDTIIKKYFIKDKKELVLKISNNLSKNQLWANDTLKLKANEPFVYFDQAPIVFEAIKIKDTVKSSLDFEVINHSSIEKHIYFDKKNIEKVFISIPPAAVQGQNYALNDSINFNFSVQKEKETGVMIVEFDTIPEYGVLVISNKAAKYEKRVVFDGVEKTDHRIEYMQPGEYSFHYIYDLNRDGKWTTGSIFNDVEAEVIEWFSSKSTIRANWEVKTTLPIKVVKMPTDEEIEVEE